MKKQTKKTKQVKNKITPPERPAGRMIKESEEVGMKATKWPAETVRVTPLGGNYVVQVQEKVFFNLIPVWRYLKLAGSKYELTSHKEEALKMATVQTAESTAVHYIGG